MTTDNYIQVRDGKVQSFVGPKAIDVFTMRVLASALKLYAETGMKANRAYTPKAMMDAAARWTGQKFKSRDYVGAAKAVALKADDTQREFVEVRRG